MKKNYITFCFLAVMFLTLNVNAQCIEESHSPFKDQGWLSCSESLSVIPERGINHWLLYDFKYSYEMVDMQLWNHNVWGETGMGVKSIIIDYSTNATDWTTIGPIDIEKAPGSWKYVPTELIDLSGVICRYMLITVVDTWEDAPCAGIGEVKINVESIVVSNEDIAIDQYKVFPNPATESINIDLKDGNNVMEIALYNSVGQLVTRIPYNQEPRITYPIMELQDGMYYIGITNNDGTVSKPFAKI